MKGGLVVSAYKSGSQTSVENYRSLLLSSHLGKALRRTIRQRLVPFYVEKAQDFHCSVKQGGSVSHASQGLRLILSAARSRHMSSVSGQGDSGDPVIHTVCFGVFQVIPAGPQILWIFKSGQISSRPHTTKIPKM